MKTLAERLRDWLEVAQVDENIVTPEGDTIRRILDDLEERAAEIQQEEYGRQIREAQHEARDARDEETRRYYRRQDAVRELDQAQRLGDDLGVERAIKRLKSL